MAATRHFLAAFLVLLLVLQIPSTLEAFSTVSPLTRHQEGSSLLRREDPQQQSTVARASGVTHLFGVRQRVTSSLGRVRDCILLRDRSDDELRAGIAAFYDRSSELWYDVWGEHMHHGYYVPANRTDHQQAQVDLIDEVLKWAHVPSTSSSPKVVLDAGCGIGGSSRHLARKYNCSVTGITLSPYQASRGNELCQEQGLDDLVSLQVTDALNMPFANDTFDLIWSLESGEHMPNKRQFVDELWRVTAPGGRIILVTWCHRDLEPDETALKPREERLLRAINRAYYLPKWCSVQDYMDLWEDRGALDLERDDWSYIIAPFWKAVIRSSLNLRSLVGLIKSGFTTQRGAVAMFLMLRGFQKGLIKFGLVTCTKPR